MEWYWIILIGVGYLTIGGIVDAIANRFDSGIDDDITVALVIFWPLIIVIFIWLGIIFGIVKGCRWAVDKLFYAFALLIDKIKSRLELRKAKKASRSQHEYAEEPDPVIDDIDYVRRS